MPYKNAEERRKYHREYMKKWSKAHPDYHRKWLEEHKEKTREYRTRYKRKLKQKLVDEFGGKCEICGYDDLRVLVFHHINGNKDEYVRDWGKQKYEALLKDKENLQLLCANCHIIVHSKKLER